MKSFFVALSFIFFSFLTPVFGLKLSLRENVTVFEKKARVSDLIFEKYEDKILDIVVVELQKNFYRLTSGELISKLIENGYKDISVSGKETLICYCEESDLNDEKSDGAKIDLFNPTDYLSDYLASLIDKDNFKIKINVLRTEPKIDLENVKSDFNWSLGKFNDGLKDIIELKKAILFIEKKKYTVYLDVNIFGDVYISKKSFLENDFFNKDNFIRKNIDISIFKDSDTIVFDIDKVTNSRFVKAIGAGEVLKRTNIKKIPLVVKDEDLKLKIKRSNIAVEIKCKSLQDGYENEKIKIKLDNGREKIGLLRKDNGEIYVEI